MFDELKLIPLILAKVNTIMATMEEHTAALNEITAQVGKIGSETSVLLVKISDLEDAIASSGATTPEVDAALEALKAQVKVVDDLVADVPTAPAP